VGGKCVYPVWFTKYIIIVARWYSVTTSCVERSPEGYMLSLELSGMVKGGWGERRQLHVLLGDPDVLA